ncbi:nuclear transport factor 2 family protein [Mycolicibacterium chubuense]|nr:nuclear transport factor 2 family protein [Mycolicibacterium chubuense]
MEAVRRYVDAFNRADASAMTDECADPMQILDGMAPHVWQGESATEQWWRDVQAESAHLGVGNYRILLDEPRHADVHGESAYLVYPASMSFDKDGTRHTQAGSVFTVALRRVAGRWRLAAWSWAKGH